MQAQSLSSEAKSDIAISRALINDKRNTALAFNMSFTDQERDAFWPLYREYRVAMNNVGSRKLDVIIDYADHVDTMTEARAKRLLDQSFAVQKEAIKVKEKYVRRFRRILPQTKVVRLMQLENRMDTMIDIKISEGIPLME